MKKSRLIIVVGLLLISSAAFLIYKNQKGTARDADRDFAVKDTASVAKIFLADRGGKSILLERQGDGSWTVNKKYVARQEGVNFLLDGIYKIRVQSRVSKNAYNNIVKELSSTGIKCEIYLGTKNKPAKTFYVGGSTQDNLGTFMMLEKAEVPYVTEVPGFTGYLTPRFSTIENDWRSTLIFALQPEQIKSVSIGYRDHPEDGFILEKKGSGYRIYSPVTNREIPNPDTLKINLYLSHFRNLHFEAWDRSLGPSQVDSLRNLEPVMVLTLEETSGNKTILPMYLRKLPLDPRFDLDPEDTPDEFDKDRMYSFGDNGRELITVQYFTFNKLLVRFDDFLSTDQQRKK